MSTHHICFCLSFSSEGETSELSKHIKGVVEVGGSKRQDTILKIKAELDCYRGVDNDLIKRNSFHRGSLRSRIRRSSTQPVLNLERFKEQPDSILYRACSTKRMKPKKPATNRTSKLGLLVEKNTNRGGFLF